MNVRLGGGVLTLGFALSPAIHAQAFDGTVPASEFESLLRVKRHSAPAGIVPAPVEFNPLGFESNRGQAHPQVKFLSRDASHAFFFTENGIVLVFADQARGALETQMRFKGGKAHPEIESSDPLPGRDNYLFGTNPANWTTDIPVFGKLRYREVYPGVDAVFYGNQGELEHDFIVAPGTDPREIRLEFTGARRLRIDAQGDLLLETPGGVIRQRKPVLYQGDGNSRTPVNGGFALRGQKEVGFFVGPYDTRKTLLIDPVITFSGGFGGSGTDQAFGVGLDPAGNTYVTGSTTSIDFPTSSPYQMSYGGGPADVFVTKFDPGGKIIYSTYLGGPGDDEGFGIKADAQGNAYLTGYTTSANFPVSGPFSHAFAGIIDAFVVKLDPSGKLLFSTCLGGTAEDAGQRLVLDSAGNAYVAGFTRSTNFPTQNPFQAGLKGGYDAFVTKLAPTGQILQSTYLGGTQNDAANSLVVDGAGNVYVTGFTQSKDFPATVGTYKGGMDVFVAQMDPSGNLSQATFYGGSGDDSGSAIALGAFGTVTVIGSTTSTDLPVTADATQTKLITGQANGFRVVLGTVPSDYSVNVPAPLTPVSSSSYHATPGLAVTGTQIIPVAASSSPSVAAEAALGSAAAGNPTPQVIYFGIYEFHVFSEGTGCPSGYFGIEYREDQYDSLLAKNFNDTYYAMNTICVTATELNDLDFVRTKILITVGQYLAGVGVTTPISISNLSTRPKAVANATHAFAVGASFPGDPNISPGGVVNAASFVEGPVSPGEIVTIFGANIGPASLAGASLNSAGLVDTTSGGTQVLFDDVPSPMVYSLAGQVSAVVPYGVAGRTNTLVAVGYQGMLAMTAAVVPVTASNPAIFTAGSGTGQAAALNQDNSYNTAATPADKNSIVVFYATGEGQTTPAGVDGKPATSVFPKPVLPVSVTIGGLPAVVQYYGAAPDYLAGLMQLNVTVPAGVTSGPSVPLLLTVGNASSQPGVTIAVR